MTRLAILGLDGATFDVIRPLAAAGDLPNIRRILEEGAAGELQSETPPITPPAWASMMTGLNPGRHGIYHFIRRVPGSYETPLVDSRNFSGKDILSLLARRGWTVGSLNVPMTYPPFPLQGGYMLSGLPMPLQGEGITWPPEMKAEIDAFLGHPYRADVDYGPYQGDREPEAEDLDRYEALRDEIFRIERDRLALVEEWLHRHPTDLFFYVVWATDRCQHYFWRFQDPSHPGWSAEGERRFGGVIRDAYRLADEFVGRVRGIVGEEVPFALLSDHGFGPYTADFFVNRWLEEEGFLVRRRPPYWTWGRTTLADALARLGLDAFGRRLGRLGRLPVARPKRKTRGDLRDVVWPRTRAFSALHGICLNLRGREPQGIVEPGEEARRTLAEIEGRLGRLRGLDGEKVFDFAAVAERTYRGPHLREAPDLQFQLAGLSCLPKEDWDAPALFARRRNAPISGQHRFQGIFAFQAPGVAAGHDLSELHIRDVAPTLLHAVGEPVPAWMEGRVHAGLFPDAGPPEYDDEKEPAAGSSSGGAFSEDEAAAIEESLRGLGYLQ